MQGRSPDSSGSSAPTIPDLGERYRVLGEYGRGASAVVYRVEDRYNRQLLAAKVVHAGAGTALQDALSREYAVLADLEHPGLARVHDTGQTRDGRAFVVMDAVEGTDLSAWHRAHPGALWSLGVQLCEVLDFLHGRGVLHRDLKPGNIVVSESTAYGETMGVVTLLDFGLADDRGLGAHGAGLSGTAGYLAPEVATGEAGASDASDYYALGAVLYEVLSGERAFSGESLVEVIRAQRAGPEPIEGLALEYAELGEAVSALLSPEPSERGAGYEGLKEIVRRRSGEVAPALEQAWAIARVASVGMVGKEVAWARVEEAVTDAPAGGSALVVTGPSGSGKSFVGTRAMALAKQLGRGAFRVGQQGEYEGWMDAVGLRGLRREEAWAGLWDRLSAGDRGGVLVVDEPLALTGEERELVDYVLRRRVLSGEEAAVGVVLLGRDPGAGSMFAKYGENVGEPVVLGPPGAEDLAGVAAHLVGGTRAEADRIATLVKELGETTGGLVEGLRAAVHQGVLVYSGGLFRVDPTREIDRGAPAGGYIEALWSQLGVWPQKVLGAVTTAGVAVTTDAVATVLGGEEGRVRRALDDLVRWGVVRTGESGVRVAGEATATAIEAQADADDRARWHAAWHGVFAERLSEDGADIAALEGLWRQDAATGRWRDVVGTHVALVRVHQKAEDRERVKRVSRRMLGLLADDVGCLSRRHVRMIFVKALVGALWEDRYAQGVCEVVLEEYGEIERVPPSFVPWVLRSAREFMSADEARDMADRAVAAFGKGRACSALIAIERAGVYHMMGEHGRAKKMLEEIEKEYVLKGYARARWLSSAIWNRQALNIVDDNNKLGKELEELAERLDLPEEQLVVPLIETASAFSLSQLDHTLKCGARCYRLSVLLDKAPYQAASLFHCSAAYFELGQYEKALRAVSGALEIYERLGIVHDAMQSRLRRAMNLASMGDIGAARNITSLTRDVGSRLGVERKFALAPLFLFELDVFTGVIGGSEPPRELLDLVAKVDYPPLRSYFYRTCGQLREYSGDLGRAYADYERSEKEAGARNDDWVRATLDSARVAIKLGRLSEARVKMGRASEMIDMMYAPSINIQAALVRLDMLSAAGQSVRDALKALRDAPWSNAPAPERLRLGAYAFDCATRIGAREFARSFWIPFYDATKTILGSMSTEAEKQAFLDRQRIEERLELRRALERQ